MKIVLLKYALAAVTVLAILPPGCPTCEAQGSLLPSGPPAPSMKSLDQIGPRTIVNGINTPGDANDMFIISQPGSYYLTTNLAATKVQNGITITANNVSLDLSGFTLQGFPGTYSGSAINIAGIRTNLTVRNGVLCGWETAGVEQYSSSINSYLSENLLFEHLTLSDCRVGIYASAPAVIRECQVRNSTEDGIDGNAVPSSVVGSIIAGCTVENNAGVGININYGTVSGCTANENLGSGILGTFASMTDCTANFNVGSGIANSCGNVSGCTANYNDDSGIDVTNANDSGCTVIGNSLAGVEIVEGNVSGSYMAGNETGIYGEQAGIAGCSALGNQTGISLYSSGLYFSAGTVSGCEVQNNEYYGIYVRGTGAVITGNTCNYNNLATNSSCAGITIEAASAGSRSENNHVQGTGYAGISVGGTNNIIIKNTVTGNGPNNYVISSGQITGPVINGKSLLLRRANGQRARGWHHRHQPSRKQLDHHGDEGSCGADLSRARDDQPRAPLKPMDASGNECLECKREFSFHGCQRGEFIRAARIHFSADAVKSRPAEKGAQTCFTENQSAQHPAAPATEVIAARAVVLAAASQDVDAVKIPEPKSRKAHEPSPLAADCPAPLPAATANHLPATDGAVIEEMPRGASACGKLPVE